ncbi:MAG: hypothetical protein Q9172_001512 [Xanthocarpia lactea]
MHDEALTTVNKAAEKVVLRKLDWHILPLITLIYILAFLDRANIGNGRLYGLEKDLGLNGNQFQTAISVFFATYVACEVPSTIFLKKLRPARFISGIAMLWGIIRDFHRLEGPLFPYLIIYLTFFYTRKELAVRFGYVVLGGALSGAFGGLLAYGIGHLDGRHGFRAWRWLLLIEGPPSVALGGFGWFFLADSPESAWYLSPTQRELLVIRGTRDQREASNPSANILHRSDVLAAIKDWKIWAFSVLNFLADIQIFTYAYFLPTIIKAAGNNVAAQYVGCFFIASGIYIVSGIAVVWMLSNLPRYGKRSTAVGMQLMIGTSAGIPAPYLYPTSDTPKYIMGHSVTIGLLALCAMINGVLWSSMVDTNKKRAAGKEDWKISGLTEEEIDELGDRSPRYIYAT